MPRISVGTDDDLRAFAQDGAEIGGRLDRCREGLPEWFHANIDPLCLDAPPNGELASFGMHDGRLFASTDEGRRGARSRPACLGSTAS